MTEILNRDVLRRFVTLPPGLAESITARHAEATALLARHGSALAHVNDLADERHDKAAHAADAHLAATAVRAGRPASTSGSPAADKLVGDRKAALGELDALEAAIGQLDAEVGAEFGKLINSAKTSGLADVDVTAAKYRRSVEAMLAAREAAHAAINRAAFLRLAAPSETWPEDADGRVIPVPAPVEAAMRRMSGRQLSYNPATPLVAINTLSRSGTRDYDLRPIEAAHLIAETLGAECAPTPEGN